MTYDVTYTTTDFNNLQAFRRHMIGVIANSEFEARRECEEQVAQRPNVKFVKANYAQKREGVTKYAKNRL